MFKHISAINRNKDLSVEEFRDYWKNVHSQIVRTRLPKLRKYLANFPVTDDGIAWPGSGGRMQCDAVVELHFDSLEDLLHAMAGDGWNSDERRTSSAKCIDLGAGRILIAEECVVNLQDIPVKND